MGQNGLVVCQTLEAIAFVVAQVEGDFGDAFQEGVDAFNEIFLRFVGPCTAFEANGLEPEGPGQVDVPFDLPEVVAKVAFVGIGFAAGQVSNVETGEGDSGGIQAVSAVTLAIDRGETLGLVSMGRIGRAMVARAHAFEMDVIAHDPYLPESAFKEAAVESVEVSDLLIRSDYVSIHAPLTSETKHLFNEEAFKQMKPTALILNTARGPVIEHKALVRALQEGWIAGAGIDVFEEEPLPADSPIMTLLSALELLIDAPALAPITTLLFSPLSAVLNA